VIQQRVLLMRRGGGLWGVFHDDVRTVTRGQDGYRIWLRDRDLAADEVLGIIEGLTVWPAGGALTEYWGERARGLAVHRATPLVVVDPDSPPSLFGNDGNDATDGKDATEISDGHDDQPSH